MSLVVITGPPGAGKTTVAEAVVQTFDPSVLVSGDEFFGFLRAGAIEPWLGAADEQNGVVSRAAASAAGAFASGGYTTIYDGVIGPWSLERFAQGTGLPSLDYVILLPSEDCCVERVATRSNHGFRDEAATRHMHRQFASRSMELDPKHVLVESAEDVEATARLILKGKESGRFVYRLPPSHSDQARPLSIR